MQAAVETLSSALGPMAQKLLGAVSQLETAGALETALSVQRKRGKIRRARDADIGVGRNHASLRACDVGAPLQEGGRDSGRNLRQSDVDDGVP